MQTKNPAEVEKLEKKEISLDLSLEGLEAKIAHLDDLLFDLVVKLEKGLQSANEEARMEKSAVPGGFVSRLEILNNRARSSEEKTARISKILFG